MLAPALTLMLCRAPQIPSVLTTPLNYIFHIEVRTCAAGAP